MYRAALCLRLCAHACGFVLTLAGECPMRLCAHACGSALTLAGECPLFSAWGRFEDGAPAPRERLRRE